ncbi:MAG: N-acetylmuramoyl-L-alanine amidase family protein [bacterium]
MDKEYIQKCPVAFTIRFKKDSRLEAISWYFIFLLIILMPFLSLFPAPGMAQNIARIAIDPGHGGEDKGCVGLHGTMEKDVTLQLSKRFSEILHERLGIEAFLTRREDYYVDLTERTGKANNSMADLFIGIHANSTFSPGQTGQIMIFVTSATEEGHSGEQRAIQWDVVQNRFYNESFRLGSLVAEEARNSGLWREALVKEAPILVLKGASMPAIEVEVDFLTSSQGEERLKDEWYQERICEVMYRAIVRFGFIMEEDRNEDPNERHW